MKLFIVHKKGVYRHECGGVFSSLDLAISSCNKLHEGDRDSYHAYEVRAHELDAATDQTPASEPRQSRPGEYWQGGDLNEGDVLYSIGGPSI